MPPKFDPSEIKTGKLILYVIRFVLLSIIIQSFDNNQFLLLIIIVIN